MALCELCGSINIVRAQRGTTDTFVSLITGKRPFVCRRCGWRGRRDWTDKDLRKLMDYGAGGAEPDPALSVLDEEPVAAESNVHRRERREILEGLDRAALELPKAPTAPPRGEDLARASATSQSGKPRRRRDRQRRSRRREMFATVAATALVLSLAVMLGLTGSCGGGSAGL